MRRSALNSFQVPRPTSTILGPKTATTAKVSSNVNTCLSHHQVIGDPNHERKENVGDETNLVGTCSQPSKLLQKPVEGDLNGKVFNDSINGEIVTTQELTSSKDLLEGSEDDVVINDNHPDKVRGLPPSNHAPPSLSRPSTKQVEATSSVNLATKSIERTARYAVMFTKHCAKKRKIYSEGILSVNVETGRAELIDEAGLKVGQVTKLLFSSKLEARELGNLPNEFQFEMNGFDVEIVSKLTTGGVGANPALASLTNVAVPMMVTNRQWSSSKDNIARPSSSSTSTILAQQPARPRLVKPNLPIGTSSAGPPPIMLREGNSNQEPIVLDSFLARIMRQHQIEGVKFMFECVSGMRAPTSGSPPTVLGCGLLDDMGLGKTLQAIALVWTMIKQPRSNPLCKKAVVVCPASLVGNWSREFQKFLGPVRVRPIAISNPENAARQVDEFYTSVMKPLLIVSYETYRKYFEKINSVRGFDLLICDEGHRLKSASGNKTIDALDRAPTKRRIILTGTPLQNELEEFYALVNFINSGILAEDARQFKRSFQIPIEKGRDKSSTKEERLIAEEKSKKLMDLTSTFLLRRTNEINTTSLPEKLETNVFIRLSPNQVIEYSRLIETECEELLMEREEEAQETTIQGAEMLRLISKLKQICTVPTALDSSNSSAESLLLHSFKLRFVDSLIAETIQAGDRIVLVSNVTSTLDLMEVLLKSRSIPFCRLDGSTKVADRQRVVNQFHSPTSKEKCFLLSSKAGGCGLNLIGANRLCMLDPDWNPAIDAQAMARVWREGQQKKVYIYRLFATGTIEERILQRQMMKLSVVTGVVTAKENQKNQRLSRDELKNLCVYVGNESRCDTFDLVNGQKTKPSSSKSSNNWKNYSGTEDIVDDQVLKSVVKMLGEDIATFIQQSSSRDVTPPVASEEVEDDAGDLEWDGECYLEDNEDLLRHDEELLFEDDDQYEDDLEEEIEISLSSKSKRTRMIMSEEEEEEELLS